jgi:3-dehydroquinate synthetase
MMNLISQDKKVQRGRLTFILVRGIGDAFVTREIEAAEIRAFLAEKLAQK